MPRHLAATVHAFAQLRFDQAELMEAVAADVEARAQRWAGCVCKACERAYRGGQGGRGAHGGGGGGRGCEGAEVG